MKCTLGILSAVAALTLCACSSDSDSDADTADDTSGATSSASDDTSDDATGEDEGEGDGETAAPEGDATAPGGAVDLSDGNAVTVDGFSVGGDAAGPWLTIDVSATNLTDAEAAVPSFALVCGESDTPGDYAGGTVVIGDPLAAGETVTGTVDLLIPGDRRSGSTPECPAPARVIATAVTTPDPEATTAEFAVPDDVLAELAG